MSSGYVGNVPVEHVQSFEQDAAAHGSTLAYVAGEDDLAELQKISEAAPSKADLLERFGTAGYREKPDGSWTLDVDCRSTRDKADVIDSLRPQMGLELQRSGKTQARIAQVDVRRPDGVVVRVAAGNAKRVCEMNGCLPVIRHGGLPVRRFSDGLLYREVAGTWEPIQRCSLTTPYFPCGNPECEACR